MSVLKKIGLILATVTSDVSKFLNLPLVAEILGYLPQRAVQQTESGIQKAETVVGDLTTLSKILLMAEAMYQAEAGQKLGSQKLAAAAPLMQKEILLWAQSNLPGHTKIVTSPDLFAQHVKNFTSDLADLLNDFGE